MVYWLVSLPLLHGSKEDTWRALRGATANGDLSQNARFELPMDLKVGSLDALLTLSDDLLRVNTMVESVVNKIRRQATDLSGGEALLVNSRPVTSYLTSFMWDEAKYPSRKPLKDIVEQMFDSVQAIDDELKVKTVEYQQQKQMYTAANRKSTGSLAVKDLRTIIKPEDIIDTENLMTLVVIVPKYNLKDFSETYESLAQFVVPRSGKIITQDNEYAIMRVVLFRRVADEFKQGCRTKGCQTREYNLSENEPNSSNQTASALREMEDEMEAKKADLEAWCRNSYGEAFSAWIHLCAVRLFAESVLRYGLPPQFQACIIHPSKRAEEKTRRALAETFGAHGARFWKDDGSSTAMEGDMHPYVSFTLDLES